jgi:hypothetical protein
MSMGRETNHAMPNDDCLEWRPVLVLLAAGEELDAAAQLKVSEHVAHCSSCSRELARENELLSLVSDHSIEPDAALLASCRATLVDALDRQEEGWWRRTVAFVLPSDWLSPRPAWSAALLLILGFSVGAFGPRLLARHTSPLSSPETRFATPAAPAAQQIAAPGSSSLDGLDLPTADVAGINVFPSAGGDPPRVQLQMKAQQPVTVQGTVDDSDVKRVLCYVLGNSDRFDPDVRLNAVDLLRARNNDPEVRSVLCHAVHSDRNAAVRLKALEALDGAEPQDLIRQTLLDALVDDRNTGVRIEAINALRGMAAQGQVVPDAHTMSVLRDRMQKDPNTYIRLQSAEAIRDLGPHPDF